MKAFLKKNLVKLTGTSFKLSVKDIKRFPCTINELVTLVRKRELVFYQGVLSLKAVVKAQSY